MCSRKIHEIHMTTTIKPQITSTYFKVPPYHQMKFVDDVNLTTPCNHNLPVPPKVAEFTVAHRGKTVSPTTIIVLVNLA